MKIDSEQEMLDYGRRLAGQLKAPAVVELVGDVGAGKTTLVRGLAAGLRVTEAVTSPSFSISKRYALPGGGELVHYDFYRLAEPGLMSEDLKESMGGDNIVVVEWAESVEDMLGEHITIEISQTEDGGREVRLV